MDNLSSLVGKPLKWSVKGIFKPDWRLTYEDRTVATLVTRKYHSLDREASYDGFQIQLLYNRKLDSMRIQNRTSGEAIGVIENITVPVRIGNSFHYKWSIKCQNGLEYSVRGMPNEGSLFEDRQGRALSRTVFTPDYPQTSEFTLLHSDNLDINLWLMALISHYYSMTIVAGSGAM